MNIVAITAGVAALAVASVLGAGYVVLAVLSSEPPDDL